MSTGEGIDYAALGMTPKEAALDEKFSAMLEKLGETGWVFGGGGSNVKGQVDIGFVLPPEIRRISTTQASFRLGMYNGEGNLLPGWELLEPTEDLGDQVQLSYTGPIDKDFETIVGYMLELAGPEVLGQTE